jgi:hypothetical protein
MVIQMKDPINVVVTNYPTLAVYYDSEAEKKEIQHLLARMIPAGDTDAARKVTERQIDACSWKIRWTTQKAAKFETLMGVYNFPTNNIMMSGALDAGYAGPDTQPSMPFPIPGLVMEKLEELHQEFLARPELTVRLCTTEPTATVYRPDLDLELRA